MHAFDAERWARLGAAPDRWSESDKRDSLDLGFAKQLESIEAELKAAGFFPVLWTAWRSPREQDRMVGLGRSSTRFSYHNVLGPDAEPASRAADYVDAQAMWGTRRIPDPSHPGQMLEILDPRTSRRAEAFFRAIGAAAKRNGLTWGGDFSIRASSPWSVRGLGWDPGHVQADPGEDLPRWEAATRRILDQHTVARRQGSPPPRSSG